jgi:hypothetical protein
MRCHRDARLVAKLSMQITPFVSTAGNRLNFLLMLDARDADFQWHNQTSFVGGASQIGQSMTG